MLGDLNIAEPAPLIGFAGPRVIEQTIPAEVAGAFNARISAGAWIPGCRGAPPKDMKGFISSAIDLLTSEMNYERRGSVFTFPRPRTGGAYTNRPRKIQSRKHNHFAGALWGGQTGRTRVCILRNEREGIRRRRSLRKSWRDAGFRTGMNTCGSARDPASSGDYSARCEKPASRKIFSRTPPVDPFPFVPAICTHGYARSGRPKRSSKMLCFRD